MKKIFSLITLCLLITISSLNLSAQVGRIINIPGRAQWNSDSGYCGEESLQMIGLYYGNYISEIVTRTIAGGWFLIGDNDGPTLNSLSFNYEDFDFNQSTPQYQNYLVWLKKQLYKYHPVIITVYMQGMTYPDYDHIIPAVGFSGADTTTFHNTDELMFNDCFASSYFTRTFQSMWDTRSMTGNGANYVFCIPKNIDFGCAITGNKDDQHVTKPVHLSLDRWDEPDVTQGEQPVIMNAVITVDSLNIGQKYALLRYDNYAVVPSTGFNPAGASNVTFFTASDTTQTFTGTFMSNTAVFYRCIPYNFTYSEQKTSLEEHKLIIYPNPTRDYLTIESYKNSSVEIINSNGQVVKKLTLVNSNNMIDLRELTGGVYTIRNKTDKEMMTKKFIKL